MLTEDEILENKTQTLEEVLAQVEQQQTGTFNYDAHMSDKLDVAVEAMGNLCALYRTIEAEGVSSHDVKALRSIQASVESIGVELPVTVALERYDGMFTPDRTALNHKVSLEATSAEFLKTLKEWFYKLVDMVVNVYQWMKNISHTDTVLMAKIDGIRLQLANAESGYQAALALRAKLTDRDMQPKLDAIATTILTDPKLTRSPLMLMALGTYGSADKIKVFYRDTSYALDAVLKEADELSKVVQGKGKEVLTRSSTKILLGSLVEQAKKLATVSDDEKYFIDNKDVGLEFYKNYRKYNTQVMAYHFILKGIDQIARYLKDTRRFDLDMAAFPIEMLHEKAASITGSMKSLEEIVDILKTVYACQYRAHAITVNYFIEAREAVRQDIVDNFFSDVTKLALDKLDKTWEKVIYDLGL